VTPFVVRDSPTNLLERRAQTSSPGDNDRYIEVTRHAIAVNVSFANTQRMLQQYVLSAYFR